MRPTFVACSARSGSTLLRFLLDSHPDIACGSEADFGPLIEKWQSIEGALSVHMNLHYHVDAAVDEYLDTHGKSVWIDKSLSNIMHLDRFAEMWPEARFILLHRNPMDFIANALEVQPWGLSEYGFLPYAAQSPGDSVGALARYWMDRAERLLAFERSHSERCARLTYEQIVRAPSEALEGVWQLLGVSPAPSVQTDAFNAPHDAWGFGDHEIWYENSVTDRSVGQGSRIPPNKITGELRYKLNGLVTKLGYEPVTDWWGSGGEIPLVASSDDTAIRVMSRGQVIRHPSSAWDFTTQRPVRGLIVVESEAVDPIKDGTLNIGSALRSRLVRRYGPPLTNYGEERALFEYLPKMI